MPLSEFQKLQELIELQLPQQVIQNYNTLVGCHYNGDADFLDDNIAHAHKQLQDVLDDTHIELVKYRQRGDDMFKMNHKEYQHFLKSQLYQRISMLMTNQINLSFSEN